MMGNKIAIPCLATTTLISGRLIVVMVMTSPCIKAVVALLISGTGSSTKARVVSHEMARGGALGSEVDVPREHGGDAGDLLPLVHHVVARRVRLEI